MLEADDQLDQMSVKQQNLDASLMAFNDEIAKESTLIEVNEAIVADLHTK